MDKAQQSYKLAEALREHWADLMLDAIRQNGHVYLSEGDYYKLKEDLMQLLIGRIPI